MNLPFKSKKTNTDGRMSSEFLIFMWLLVVVIYYLRARRNEKQKLLPGPFGWPIVGNALQLRSCAHKQFTIWAERYGPIYQIKMGKKKAVVVSDPKLIKEIFNDSATTGRMTDNPAVYEFTKGTNGIINSDGATWEEQRRFTMKTLKNLGITSKSSLETLILDEVQAMVYWFRLFEGTPMHGNRIFNAPVVNSLWRIVTGDRCEWEKENTRVEILTAADELFKAMMEITKNGILFVPFIRKIAPEMLGWNRYVKGVDTMFQLITSSIEYHKKTVDYDHLRDFIDHYLYEVKITTDQKSSFYKRNGDANLLSVVYDLFIGGSETTSSVLSWALLYLSQHPKIQAMLQQEIDWQLDSRKPSLQDRLQMPYTEAVISELLRLTTVLSFGVPHTLTRDSDFHGYLTSKGTSVFANIHGVHYNPKLWTNPKVFRPERFLSKDGSKFIKRDDLIAFSEGKRKCPGEGLARDTLFLFVAGIFQQFNVRPEICDVNNTPDFEPEQSCFLVPKPFKIVITSRQND